MKPQNICRAVITLGLFLTITGCSSPKITIGETAPPAFTMSGNNQANLFQVSDGENVIWKIYPKANRFKLSEFGAIVYGQVPASCEQAIPKDQPPPALVEGKIYQGVAVISDAEALRVTFEIKDGTVINDNKLTWLFRADHG